MYVCIECFLAFLCTIPPFAEAEVVIMARQTGARKMLPPDGTIVVANMDLSDDSSVTAYCIT